MASSRYKHAKVVAPEIPNYRNKRTRAEEYGLSSFPSIDPAIFAALPSVEHVVTQGERMDVLARKYYGNGRYWWCIAITNGIIDPFNGAQLKVGQELTIVIALDQILEVLRLSEASGGTSVGY